MPTKKTDPSNSDSNLVGDTSLSAATTDDPVAATPTEQRPPNLTTLNQAIKPGTSESTYTAQLHKSLAAWASIVAGKAHPYSLGYGYGLADAQRAVDLLTAEIARIGGLRRHNHERP